MNTFLNKISGNFSLTTSRTPFIQNFFLKYINNNYSPTVHGDHLVIVNQSSSSNDLFDSEIQSNIVEHAQISRQINNSGFSPLSFLKGLKGGLNYHISPRLFVNLNGNSESFGVSLNLKENLNEIKPKTCNSAKSCKDLHFNNSSFSNNTDQLLEIAQFTTLSKILQAGQFSSHFFFGMTIILIVYHTLLESKPIDLLEQNKKLGRNSNNEIILYNLQIDQKQIQNNKDNPKFRKKFIYHYLQITPLIKRDFITNLYVNRSFGLNRNELLLKFCIGRGQVIKQVEGLITVCLVISVNGFLYNNIYYRVMSILVEFSVLGLKTHKPGLYVLFSKGSNFWATSFSICYTIFFMVFIFKVARPLNNSLVQLIRKITFQFAYQNTFKNQLVKTINQKPFQFAFRDYTPVAIKPSKWKNFL